MSLTPADQSRERRRVEIDLTLEEATETATRVRDLYHQVEERLEGSRWSAKDDMLGLVNDTGEAFAANMDRIEKHLQSSIAAAPKDSA